mmetsp:Transcript_4035/g.6851  ORF Transcript_4035/g.6851 Transcript_4035/m.6851 type:complete len:89 (+) Transcript_4035:1628-1894(+)
MHQQYIVWVHIGVGRVILGLLYDTQGTSVGSKSDFFAWTDGVPFRGVTQENFRVTSFDIHLSQINSGKLTQSLHPIETFSFEYINILF